MVAQRPSYALTECAGDCFVSGVDNLQALGYVCLMSEQHKVVVTYHSGKKVTFTRTSLREAAKLRKKMGRQADVKDAIVVSSKPIIPKRKDIK